jgi:PAS domain S-box-containing protein
MTTNEDRIEVLLVEDSPSDAQLLCELLQGYPPQMFAIERAERLEEAIGLVAERTFDVVLLDLTLPDSTGLDTCARMRRAAPHVPIVVLTGVDDETMALEAMRQGVEDYLVKGQIHGGTVGRATRYAVERSRSELALRESEERLKRSQEIAHLGSWELDLVQNRLTWSDEVYRIFGLKPQEFGATYEAFLARVHPDDRAAVDAAYSGSLRENRDSYEIEHRLVRRSTGEIRIVHEKCEHFRDASGRIVRSVGMVHDITERKRAEEQLVKLNRTLKALSDSSHALMRATEESAYLQEICKIVVEDCGYAMVWIGYAEQDEAKSVRLVAYAGFEEGYLETLQLTWADTERGRGPTGTAIRTGQPCLCRNMLTDPSFAPWREQAIKRGYASSIVLPLLSFGAITIYSRQPDPFSRDEVELLMELAADLAYGIGSLRLHAAHARDEEALRESEARLRLAQDAANAGTWEWDLRTNQNFWSDELWKLYGLELHGCEPSYEAWRQTVHPDDRGRVEAAVQEAARRGIELKAEWRVRDRQGEERWLMSRGRPVHDASGQTARYRGIVLDITERKQMEAELQRLNDQLEEEVQARTEELKDTVDRLREEVARRVQAEHDLRKRSEMLEHRAHQLQKLTLELSQAEDRERKRLAEILHDDLQQQLAAAKFHLSLLSNRVPKNPATRDTIAQLDQILKDSIEKSRSLSHELSPAVLYQSDLGETFEWLARQLKAKHGLTVDVESRGRIESQSEPLKAFLYKTAQEILFNVVKHACVKEARLRVQRMHGRVWVTISDPGRGFDPRSLGRTGGLGLLSIRERIELLGGRMKIRSAPGRGSTFLIAVPDGEEGKNAGRAEGKRGRSDEVRTFLRSEVPSFSPSALHSDHRLRVLLVDDHKVMREGLAALLNEQSDLAVVGQAGNGREAVDLAYQLEPDVVVMDAAMPVMAGDEATRQIKLHLPNVRIVALSMFEGADMAEAMRQAGAEAYLLKTRPSDELLAAIRGRRG